MINVAPNNTSPAADTSSTRTPLLAAEIAIMSQRKYIYHLELFSTGYFMEVNSSPFSNPS